MIIGVQQILIGNAHIPDSPFVINIVPHIITVETGKHFRNGYNIFSYILGKKNSIDVATGGIELSSIRAIIEYSDLHSSEAIISKGIKNNNIFIYSFKI